MSDPPPPESNELVLRARNGDLQAFERLYRVHVGRVHGLCLRLTADEREAEELVQQVFIRAWRGLDGFRGESAFASWLHRLAVNRFRSSLRSRRRRWRREAAAARATGGAVERAPGAAIDLERAIGTLPPRARAVFVLHDVEGYRHREVAELLGVAEGTCKAQLHRARRLLREALER